MTLSIKAGDSSNLSFASSSGIGSARRDEETAQQLIRGEINLSSLDQVGSEDAASVQIDGAGGLALAITVGNSEKAQDAVAQIAALRSEQAELTELAANSPQNSFTESLNTELQLKQEEIERVADAATDQNGVSLLANGSGSGILLEAYSRSGAVGSSNQIIASDLNLDVSDQVSAQESLDSLAEQDLGLSVTQAGFNSATSQLQAQQEDAAQAAEAQANGQSSESEQASPAYNAPNVAAQLGINAYSQQQELVSLISATLSSDSSEQSGLSAIA